MPTNRTLEAVGAMMKVHCEIMGVPLNADKETLVWHMIASLLEYCDDQVPPVDFDLQLEMVREHFRGECTGR